MKALYFYPTHTSFVKLDAVLMRKHGEVTEFYFKSRRKWLTPWFFISQFFFILIRFSSSSIFVCHFAGYHSFLPALMGQLLRRPCLIILAGTDCQSFPSFGYGNFQKPLLGKFTAWSMKLATHLAPVHQSLVEYEYTYTTDDFPKQGYRYFDPRITTPHTEIPYGYEVSRFRRSEGVRTPNSFLTVAQSLDAKVYQRKGIDLILGAASAFPDFSFTIVGGHRLPAGINVPPNVKLIPPVPYDELVTIYNRHEFYFQVSIAEGFPNALCEAMLCGCIPIGSHVAAIPLIVAGAGFILNKREVSELEKLISVAASADKKFLSAQSHARIAENFPLELRELKLMQLISSLTSLA